MATQITINGRSTSIPNIYSTIKSGIVNPPNPLDFGNILIIDDGSLGTGISGGIGVNGTNAQGVNSVYAFTTLAQFQAIIKDGPLYQLGAPLFIPNGSGSIGANTVFYLKAATTAPGTTTITLAKGTIVLTTNEEGPAVNGILTPLTYNPSGGATISNELATGYAARIEKGRAFGYSLVFYKGATSSLRDTLNTSVPTNWDGSVPPIDLVTAGVHSAVNPATLMFRSPDCTNIRQLQQWLQKSADVKSIYKSAAVTFTGTNNFDDLIASADQTQYTAIAPYSLIAGATETFASTDFDSAITAVKNIDNTFFLGLGYGSNVYNVNNLKIFNLLTGGDLRYDKYMIVAGGQDADGFASSITVAQEYNSQHVVVVHAGGTLTDTRQPNNILIVSQLYKAAMILGRVAGLEPQTPVTFKQIGLASDLHIITQDQEEQAIDAGLTYTKFDSELDAFIVGYGLTTLQDNEFLVNADGSSYDLAVERIKSQLNKSIIINAKRTFFGTNNGPNRNTISPADIQTWLAGFLTTVTATPQQDNLIIRWDNITVTVDQDIYYVNYEFVPNFPVSKIVFTGLMLNS